MGAIYCQMSVIVKNKKHWGEVRMGSLALSAERNEPVVAAAIASLRLLGVAINK
jgi:hypothetical protein